MTDCMLGLFDFLVEGRGGRWRPGEDVALEDLPRAEDEDAFRRLLLDACGTMRDDWGGEALC